MIVAIPRGWVEAVGLDPAAEVGPGATLRQYRNILAGMDPDMDWDQVKGLVASGYVTRDCMAYLPQLRVVSLPGTGVGDYVDVPEATRQGIIVCNIRDYASQTVAELTMGLMISLSRRLFEADRLVRTGLWASEPSAGPDLVGMELHGRTLGLVGLGSIGRRVAILGAALGMNVLCTTRRPFAQRSIDFNVEFVSLYTLLERADIVSIHTALTEETRSLIDRRAIARMKRGAFLINTSRGTVIDQDALTDALEARYLGGAALDVFSPEPLRPTHRLTQLPNVVLTPHLAARTREAQIRSIRQCLANIRCFMEGHPQNVINPEVLMV